MLCEKLDSLDIPHEAVREPGGTSISEKIRDILLDKNHLELSPITESLLFLSARSQLSKEVIIPSLSDGKFVLCDRYTDSTLAYQGFGRGLDVKALDILNNYATQSTIPKLTFLFDIDLETSIKRRDINTEDRMESSGIVFLKKVQYGYHQIESENKSRFKVIDGNRNPHEIFDEIWNVIQKNYKAIKR